MSSSSTTDPASNAAQYQELLSLATSISTNVQTILQQLQSKGLPPPSAASDGPSPDFIPTSDAHLQALRREVVGNARQLISIFSGPRKHVLDLCTLPIVYSYKIPQHVPLDGSISFADLSKACGLEEDKLTRIIRFLVLHQLFQEPETGRVSHSASSKLLATSQVDMDFLGHNTEEMMPACWHQIEAMKKSPGGTSVLDCGMTLGMGEGKRSFFEILKNEPSRMTRFSGAMRFANLPGSPASPASGLLLEFDWKALGNAKVVDVGGSQGHTAEFILRHASNISDVTVQDLPEVIAGAKKKSIPDDLAGRLQFQAASFFDPQPIKDADVYVFRFIFHDWPDAEAHKILQNLVPSMKPGSRLIVDEAIQYTPRETDMFSCLASRRIDLQMMVAMNARERSVAEWTNMTEKAVPGALKLELARRNILVFQKQ